MCLNYILGYLQQSSYGVTEAEVLLKCGLLPMLITEGNAKFQLESGKNEDVIFSAVWVPRTLEFLLQIFWRSMNPMFRIFQSRLKLYKVNTSAVPLQFGDKWGNFGKQFNPLSHLGDFETRINRVFKL